MKKWFGSAGICINEKNEVLMVLQAAVGEEKKWAVPSGGREEGETFADCCMREMEEETGYMVEIVEELKVKKDTYEDFFCEVHYFKVKLTGGEAKIQDPDQLIYDIAWKTEEEINNLTLSFPEDREYLISLLQDPAIIR